MRRTCKITACLLSAIVLAFLIVLLGGCEYDAEAAVTGSAVGITSAYVRYKDEQIEIVSTQPVYYAILKKATDQSAKKIDFLPAAYDTGGNKYYVDISNLSASKENYVGLTTNLTAGADGTVPVANAKIYANQKKVVFNVNWGVEGIGGADIIQSVDVTEQNNTFTSYQHVAVSDSAKSIGKIDNIKELIQWRKGANCAWQDISELKPYMWDSMKNSGAVIYFRLSAVNDDNTGKEGQRYSKETKVKVSITKAPAVKIDVNKLTIGIKNGMQIRIKGTTATPWTTVLPYNAKSTNEELYRLSSVAGTFNPYTDGTKAKASAVSLEELKTKLGASVLVTSSGTAFTLEVRIAATTKKPASRIAEIDIPVQSGAPTVSGITKQANTTGYEFHVGTLTATDTLVAKPAFEYALVHKTDYPYGVDMSTLKWNTVNQGTIIRDSMSSTYILKNGTRKSDLRADSTDALLLIRRKGKNSSKNEPAVLASECYTCELGSLTVAK